ncbi:hypothetical protein [Kibdelosporangium aridum]|uniref:Uncharacterized protein n=1 Tax=Kibdelosporangium aridum TaxID=2030 RepID=A0A1W1ZFP1_KIBAR|nr:hypothetical protein [Kibdelosporangium aridum]SMC47310.1 hypothetical protein SAMN05661093_00027 [Kibdelosporangium aridum]
MIIKFARIFVALAAALGMLVTPAFASAASAATVAKAKPTTLTLDAGGAQVKVKKGNKLSIKGTLGAPGHERELTLGLNVFAQINIGASGWVDLTSKTCHPNSTFNLKLSIDVSADLRLYFPGTDVYASATSNIVGVVVF